MILFRKVRYKNFMSAGNIPLEVDLDKHDLTLISGKNGKGKSTISEAITFGLYGKAYRNITKPQLVNSINQKQCVVEIEFDIGKKKYLIKRGIKPSIFEIRCDGILVNQDPNVKDYQKVLEQQILKMNYRAFTQVVMMGSGTYVPFMRLKPNERREFIEDLLDIRIFSTMGMLHKEKIKQMREEVSLVDAEIKLAREKFTLQEGFIKRQAADRDNIIAGLCKEIDSLQLETDQHQKDITYQSDMIAELQVKAEKYDGLDEALSEVKLNAKNIRNIISSFSDEREFYSTIDECPQCKQSVGSDHRTHIVNSVESKIKQQEESLGQIEKELSNLTGEYKKWEDLLTEINSHNTEISRLNKLVSVNVALIATKRQQIENINSNKTNTEEETKKLKDMARAIVAYTKQKQSLQEIGHYQTAISSLLQDSGIKAKIIKQYIPLINKLVNKYLDSLDLFISFNLDEQFNEVVKSRYRDTFTYESFSEGQKMRISLAILFAWRDVAKSKNSVNCNLLFFDETLDSSVDNEGSDMFIDLLRMQKGTNVFVISHKDTMYDKFDHVIRVDMVNNFSVMS